MHTLVFRVSGLVQHVWFRGWTQLTAKSLGLVGWVRNLPDGAVAGEAQPREDTPAGRAALETFREALRQGPPSAVVQRVEATYGDSPERYADFSVRR